MKKTVHTIGAALVIGGALGALPAQACAHMSGVRIAAADTEHAGHNAAPTGGAKARVGDEVACAVDGMRMRLSADTPAAEHGGKTYYFCSDSEKQKFVEHPERYFGH